VVSPFETPLTRLLRVRLSVCLALRRAERPVSKGEYSLGET